MDKRISTLYDAIAHGDEAHRAWLKEAIDDHFAGRVTKPAMGLGTKEAMQNQINHLNSMIEMVDAFVDSAQFAGVKMELLEAFIIDYSEKRALSQ